MERIHSKLGIAGRFGMERLGAISLGDIDEIKIEIIQRDS
jgi:hypothetical protein